MPTRRELAREIVRRARRDGVELPSDDDVVITDLVDQIDPTKPVPVLYHQYIDALRDDAISYE